MKKNDDKVVCESPNPGAAPTRIDRWKYDVVRSAILDALAERPSGFPFKDLAARVTELLPAATLRLLGSVSWYTTTVKLDLEVRGEIERVPDAKPQLLRAKESH